MTVMDALAFEFFREFARCEYCLKTVGLRPEPDRAEANWSAFAREVSTVLDTPALADDVRYLIEHPPKKQIVRNDLLEWSDRLPDHDGQAELVLLLICRVRNNLFHGGKFNDHWFEPERSRELITRGLKILRACIAGHPRVNDAYERRAEAVEVP